MKKSIRSCYITGATGIHNPANTTTYYYGCLINTAPTTTANQRNIPIPLNGVINNVNIRYSIVGTQDSAANNGTFYLRHNNTTDYTLSTTATWNGATKTILATNLGITVSRGDFVEVKFTTPTFSTGPTTVLYNVVIEVEPA